eukprot:TRINITY_DN3402_c0_g1_i2.p1 TRINITY_DN3402_c0_g1~~TRINITY_DN3402_c0_g1_i2.p1  ORF type:complete len:170 (+),score=41.72 TRINITY_DN3402_c0_g1_i2:53-562(+)
MGDAARTPSQLASSMAAQRAATREAFSTSLTHVLQPVASAYTTSARTVADAQIELQEKVQLLSSVLADTMEYTNFTLPDEAHGPSTRTYQQRLASIRQRTKALGGKIEGINARLLRSHSLAEKQYGAMSRANDRLEAQLAGAASGAAPVAPAGAAPAAPPAASAASEQN